MRARVRVRVSLSRESWAALLRGPMKIAEGLGVRVRVRGQD